MEEHQLLWSCLNSKNNRQKRKKNITLSELHIEEQLQ